MELFALLGTILTTIVGAITNKLNINNANEQLANQQQFSHEEAEIANQRAMENYEATMLPATKVQQYKEAGLSTGLMYSGAGTGGFSMTSQAQTPGATLPIMVNPLQNGLNDFFENIKKMKEAENIEQDTAKSKQEIEKIKSEIDVNNAEINKIATENNLTEVLTSNAKIDGTIKQIEADIKEATKENQIKIVATQLENMKKDGEKMLQEIEGLKIDNTNKQRLYDATLKKMAAETNLLYKQAIKTEQETLLAKAETILTDEKTQLTFTERQKTYREYEQLKKLNAKIEAEIKLMEEQTGKVKLEKVSEVIGWIGEAANITNNIAGTLLKAAIVPK